MFCPNCGYNVLDDLYGGQCRYLCVYCGMGLKGNQVITDCFKAAPLREKYDQSAENKKTGEENLQKFFKDREKRRLDNLDFPKPIGGRGNQVAGLKKPVLIKVKSLDELKKILAERKK